MALGSEVSPSSRVGECRFYGGYLTEPMDPMATPATPCRQLESSVCVGSLTPLSGPPETGPSGVWSNLALTGKEDQVEGQRAHAGADRAQAPGRVRL